MADESSQSGEGEGDAPPESSPGTDGARSSDEPSGEEADDALAWTSMDLPGMDPAEGNE